MADTTEQQRADVLERLTPPPQSEQLAAFIGQLRRQPLPPIDHDRIFTRPQVSLRAGPTGGLLVDSPLVAGPLVEQYVQRQRPSGFWASSAAQFSDLHSLFQVKRATERVKANLAFSDEDRIWIEQQLPVLKEQLPGTLLKAGLTEVEIGFVMNVLAESRNQRHFLILADDVLETALNHQIFENTHGFKVLLSAFVPVLLDPATWIGAGAVRGGARVAGARLFARNVADPRKYAVTGFRAAVGRNVLEGFGVSAAQSMTREMRDRALGIDAINEVPFEQHLTELTLGAAFDAGIVGVGRGLGRAGRRVFRFRDGVEASPSRAEIADGVARQTEQQATPMDERLAARADDTMHPIHGSGAVRPIRDVTVRGEDGTTVRGDVVAVYERTTGGAEAIVRQTDPRGRARNVTVRLADDEALGLADRISARGRAIGQRTAIPIMVDGLPARLRQRAVRVAGEQVVLGNDLEHGLALLAQDAAEPFLTAGDRELVQTVVRGLLDDWRLSEGQIFDLGAKLVDNLQRRMEGERIEAARARQAAQERMEIVAEDGDVVEGRVTRLTTDPEGNQIVEFSDRDPVIVDADQAAAVRDHLATRPPPIEGEVRPAERLEVPKGESDTDLLPRGLEATQQRGVIRTRAEGADPPAYEVINPDRVKSKAGKRVLAHTTESDLGEIAAGARTQGEGKLTESMLRSLSDEQLDALALEYRGPDVNPRDRLLIDLELHERWLARARELFRMSARVRRRVLTAEGQPMISDKQLRRYIGLLEEDSRFKRERVLPALDELKSAAENREIIDGLRRDRGSHLRALETGDRRFGDEGWHQAWVEHYDALEDLFLLRTAAAELGIFDTTGAVIGDTATRQSIAGAVGGELGIRTLAQRAARRRLAKVLGVGSVPDGTSPRISSVAAPPRAGAPPPADGLTRHSTVAEVRAFNDAFLVRDTTHQVSRTFIVDSGHTPVPKRRKATQDWPKNAKSLHNGIEAVKQAVAEFDGQTRASWRLSWGSAFNSSETLVEPHKLFEWLDNPDKLVAYLERASAEGIAAADRGLATSRTMRALYESGEANEIITGKLILWSMLSRMQSTYPHESQYLDAVMQGVERFIRDALDGRFDAEEYASWVKSISRGVKSAAPNNLNDFGRLFLAVASEPSPTGAGPTILHDIHTILGDYALGSLDARLEFFRLLGGRKVGVQPKVLQMAMITSGWLDGVVLDRHQINSWWDQFGTYKGVNVSDGSMTSLVDPQKSVTRGIVTATAGPPGALTYGMIEKLLTTPLREEVGLRLEGDWRPGDTLLTYAYRELGRDPSIARFHWESWNVYSRQAADHATLDGLVREAGGIDDPYADTWSSNGKLEDFYYGVQYGWKGGVEPVVRYRTSTGVVLEFEPTVFDQIIQDIKRPETGVIRGGAGSYRAEGSGIQLTQRGAADAIDTQAHPQAEGRPWYEVEDEQGQPLVDRESFDEILFLRSRGRVGEDGRIVPSYEPNAVSGVAGSADGDIPFPPRSSRDQALIASAVEKWGAADYPRNGASFMLPDGKFVQMPAMHADIAAASAMPKRLQKARSEAAGAEAIGRMLHTGSVRVAMSDLPILRTRALWLELRKPLTASQKRKIVEIVQDYNIGDIVIDVTDDQGYVIKGWPNIRPDESPRELRRILNESDEVISDATRQVSGDDIPLPPQRAASSTSQAPASSQQIVHADAFPQTSGDRIMFVHWSGVDDLTTVDPDRYAGTGARMSRGERERVQQLPVTQAYGIGGTRERMFGPRSTRPYAYTFVDEEGLPLKRSEVYDVVEDPTNLLKNSRTFEEFEVKVRDAGFRGYWFSRHPNANFDGQARLFGVQRVRRLGEGEIISEASQFATYNVDDLTLDQATARLNSEQHDAFHAETETIFGRLGMRGSSRHIDGIGMWLDGGENAIATFVRGNVSPETVRYTAAIRGKIHHQKSMLNFYFDREGPDKLYQFSVDAEGNTEASIATALRAAGLKGFTIGKATTRYSRKKLGLVKRFDVLVVEKAEYGDDLADMVAAAYDALDGQEPQHLAGRAEFLGPEGIDDLAGPEARAVAQEFFQRVIDEYESVPGRPIYRPESSGIRPDRGRPEAEPGITFPPEGERRAPGPRRVEGGFLAGPAAEEPLVRPSEAPEPAAPLDQPPDTLDPNVSMEANDVFLAMGANLGSVRSVPVAPEDSWKPTDNWLSKVMRVPFVSRKWRLVRLFSSRSWGARMWAHHAYNNTDGPLQGTLDGTIEATDSLEKVGRIVAGFTDRPQQTLIEEALLLGVDNVQAAAAARGQLPLAARAFIETVPIASRRGRVIENRILVLGHLAELVRAQADSVDAVRPFREMVDDLPRPMRQDVELQAQSVGKNLDTIAPIIDRIVEARKLGGGKTAAETFVTSFLDQLFLFRLKENTTVQSLVELEHIARGGEGEAPPVHSPEADSLLRRRYQKRLPEDWQQKLLVEGEPFEQRLALELIGEFNLNMLGHLGRQHVQRAMQVLGNDGRPIMRAHYDDSLGRFRVLFRKLAMLQKLRVMEATIRENGGRINEIAEDEFAPRMIAAQFTTDIEEGISKELRARVREFVRWMRFEKSRDRTGGHRHGRDIETVEAEMNSWGGLSPSQSAAGDLLVEMFQNIGRYALLGQVQSAQFADYGMFVGMALAGAMEQGVGNLLQTMGKVAENFAKLTPAEAADAAPTLRRLELLTEIGHGNNMRLLMEQDTPMHDQFRLDKQTGYFGMENENWLVAGIDVGRRATRSLANMKTVGTQWLTNRLRHWVYNFHRVESANIIPLLAKGLGEKLTPQQIVRKYKLDPKLTYSILEHITPDNIRIIADYIDRGDAFVKISRGGSEHILPAGMAAMSTDPEVRELAAALGRKRAGGDDLPLLSDVQAAKLTATLAEERALASYSTWLNQSIKDRLVTPQAANRFQGSDRSRVARTALFLFSFMSAYEDLVLRTVRANVKEAAGLMAASVAMSVGVWAIRGLIKGNLRDRIERGREDPYGWVFERIGWSGNLGILGERVAQVLYDFSSTDQIDRIRSGLDNRAVSLPVISAVEDLYRNSASFYKALSITPGGVTEREFKRMWAFFSVMEATPYQALGQALRSLKVPGFDDAHPIRDMAMYSDLFNVRPGRKEAEPEARREAAALPF